jgi:hypothetical protein
MNRKLLFAGIGVALLIAFGLILATKPELIGLGGDRGKLRQLSHSFLEDIQFKDFKRAAKYHEPKLRKSVDIPYLLERLFLLKPELLDIMQHEILFSKIDSTNLRGRVKARVKYKNLANGKLQERELMLYYYRKDENSPWFMRLESSLRRIYGAPGKTH